MKYIKNVKKKKKYIVQKDRNSGMLLKRRLGTVMDKNLKYNHDKESHQILPNELLDDYILRLTEKKQMLNKNQHIHLGLLTTTWHQKRMQGESDPYYLALKDYFECDELSDMTDKELAQVIAVFTNYVLYELEE